MGIKPSIHTSVWNQTYPKLSSARKYETMPLSSRKKPLASLATLVIFFAIVFTNFVHGQQSTPTNLINDFDDYSLCTNRYAKFSPDHTACVKPNKRCKINEASEVSIFPPLLAISIQVKIAYHYRTYHL